MIHPNENCSPQMHQAYKNLIKHRELQMNFLYHVKEIADDLDAMEIHGESRDMFELGFYLRGVLEEEAKGLI